MPNYYETIKLAPSASVAEIEVACDTLYNQWRGLINHQDPNIAVQATQALHTVEVIRDTLMDPAKRAGYDAGLGLSESVGGLADPEALIRQTAIMTPPAPRNAASPAGSRGTTQAGNLWACPKCNADNPAQTDFCLKCGAQLVRKCPECQQKSSLVATGFCGKCGYKYEAAQKRVELKMTIAVLEREVVDLNSRVSESNDEAMGSPWLSVPVVMLLGGLIMCFALRDVVIIGIITIVSSILLFWIIMWQDSKKRRNIGETFVKGKTQLDLKEDQLARLVAEYDSLTISRDD